MHDIELNEKKGTYSYFGVGEKAWHGLGQTVKEAVTAEKAIGLANLDYIVEKKPAMFPIDDILPEPDAEGNLTIKVKQVAGKFHSYRTDTGDVLGTVGSAWTPLQNVDAFRFFDSVVDKSEAIYHTAGVINKGERAWILAKMPDHIRVGKDDITENYVLISNGFNGTTAVQAAITPIRTVCENTLNMALNSAKQKISIAHTPNIDKAIEKAAEMLGIFNQYNKEMEEVYNQMARKMVSVDDVSLFLETLIPKKEETTAKTKGDEYKEDILKFFETGVGQDIKTANGTVYGLVNAVTGFTSHVKEYTSGEAKMKNLLFNGTASRMNQKGFEIALEMLN